MSIKGSKKQALKLRGSMQERQHEIEKMSFHADDYARRGDMKAAEQAQDKIRELTEEMIELENAALAAERHSHDLEMRVKAIEAQERLLKSEYEKRLHALEREKGEIISGASNL